MATVEAEARMAGNGGNRASLTGWLARKAVRACRLAVFLALILVCFWSSLSRGVAMVGEGWFLQVVNRVVSGDRIYKDVAYGAGPLPVFIVAALTALLGVNVCVLKFAVACAYAVCLYLGCQLLRMAGIPPVVQFCYVGLTLAVAPTPLSPGYQVMAAAFSMGAIVVVAAGYRKGWNPVAVATLAGLQAGLATACKQNVGAYALVAILGLIVVWAKPARRAVRERLSLAAVTLGAWAAAMGVVLAPVLLRGAAGEMLEFTVANKGVYLREARIPLKAGLAEFGKALVETRSLQAIPDLFEKSAFLFVPLSLLALAAGVLARKGSGGRTGAAIAVVSLVALMSVFPRADLIHVQYAMPGLLAALFWGVYSVVRSRPFLTISSAVCWYGGAGCVACVAALALTMPALGLVNGELCVWRAPGFEGPLVPHRQAKRLEKCREWLRDKTQGQRAFILSPRAGFWYVTTGLRNPTRYDFPNTTELSRRGTDEVMAYIGNTRATVIVEPVASPLFPRHVEAEVRRRLRSAGRCGSLELFSNVAP